MSIKQKYNFDISDVGLNSSSSSGFADSSEDYTSYVTSNCTESERHSSDFRTPTEKNRNLPRTNTLLSTGALINQRPRSSRSSSGLRHPLTSGSKTPGSLSLTSSALIAIVEGRGQARGVIGFASIDLRKSVLELSQYDDTSMYGITLAKLDVLQPIEVIFPVTVFDNNSMDMLCEQINKNHPHTNIATLSRKYFNESKGLQYIKQLCLPELSTVQIEVESKYYSLAAASALFRYTEYIQNIVYAPGSVKVVFKGSENSTMIDGITARHLELVLNVRDARSPHSLFGVLNHTKTQGGTRFLRSNILEPPRDVETIEVRQEAVSELTEKPELFYQLRSLLSRCLDVDHLISACVQLPRADSVKTAESRINALIQLKHCLELVEPLRQALLDSESRIFVQYSACLNDPRFGKIMEKIDKVVNANTKYQKGCLNMRAQRCFTVKFGVNGLLDVARRTYTEIFNDFSDAITSLNEKYNFNVRSGCNSTRGFHGQITSSSKRKILISDLPAEFIKVTQFKNTISFTTEFIIKLNHRVKESLEEIYLMTDVVVKELLKEVREHIGCLYFLADSVSVLDMLVSFAHSCSLSTFVKPEFTDTLAIRQGRHPILENISMDPPVPNDTYISEENNFIIVTGPNMSGKSTLLKQIVLLQIMAQIGSFVPASYASFRLADQIFSRIGSDDCIETNSSTFTLEMREINYILKNATKSSLIIIDELGRGTSADEGVGICFAICEQLLSLEAFTVLATHFRELTDLESIYPNAENYHFEVQSTINTSGISTKMRFTHKLSKGRSEVENYGISLAEVSSLPSSIVRDAKKICEQLTKRKEKEQAEDYELIKKRAIFKLAKRLKQTANSSQLEERDLIYYLKRLKKQYLEKVSQESLSNDRSLDREIEKNY